MARAYCAPLKRAEVDTLILGCTHYPLVAPMLQRILGRDVRLVSGGHAVAAAVQRTLERAGIAREPRRRGRLPLPLHRRHRLLPRPRHPLPADAAGRGRAGRDRRRSRILRSRRHELARSARHACALRSARISAHARSDRRQYRIYSPCGKGDDLDSRRSPEPARRPARSQSARPAAAVLQRLAEQELDRPTTRGRRRKFERAAGHAADRPLGGNAAQLIREDRGRDSR